MSGTRIGKKEIWGLVKGDDVLLREWQLLFNKAASVLLTIAVLPNDV